MSWAYLFTFQMYLIKIKLKIQKVNKIYLGKYQANEPLMLGTQTVNLLKDLVQCLTSFMNLAKDATTNVIETSDGSIRPVTLPIINLAAQNSGDNAKKQAMAK